MIKLTTLEALLVPFLSGAYSLLSSIHSLVALWAESSLWWLEGHFVWKIQEETYNQIIETRFR